MIKILELKNVNLASINKKYGGKNQYTGKYFLSKAYVATQKMIFLSLKKVKIVSPVKVVIFISTYKDSDNLIHSLVNMIEKKGIIENDRNINYLKVHKKALKKGSLDSVTVFIETSNLDYELQLNYYRNLCK